MKILFVTADNPFWGYTGFYSYSRDVLRMLKDAGSIQVACLNGDQRDALCPSGIEIEFPSRRMLARHKLVSQLYSIGCGKSMIEAQFDELVALNWVAERIRSCAPDVVIFNHLRSAWMAPRLGALLPHKTIYLAHNAEGTTYRSAAELESTFLHRMLARLISVGIAELEARVCRACSATWCLSNEDGARLADSGAKLIFVIPPIVSGSGNGALSYPPDVLLVGSFNWRPKQKNAFWLAQTVWPNVRRQKPEVTLRIVGNGAAQLRGRLAKCRGVELLSDVPSVSPFFHAGSIFVVPERQAGGVKLKTLEAAAWGLPVVSTPEGVEGTPLMDGTSCVVARSAEEFARAIISLCGSESKRRRLGMAARVAVLAAHSEDAVRGSVIRALAGSA